MLVTILFWSSFFCCGTDPILERAENLKSETPKKLAGKEKQAPKSVAAKNPQPGKQSQENQLPKPGKPEQPKPGKPDDPKPVQPNDPEPVKGNQESRSAEEQAKQIQIQGTIKTTNWSGKSIRIDIFDGDQQKIGGKRPSVVATRRIKKLENFSISIPEKSPKIWIGAYIDEDEDGRPGGNDPSGWYEGNPISGKKDHRNIIIKLEKPKEQKR